VERPGNDKRGNGEAAGSGGQLLQRNCSGTHESGQDCPGRQARHCRSGRNADHVSGDRGMRRNCHGTHRHEIQSGHKGSDCGFHRGDDQCPSVRCHGLHPELRQECTGASDGGSQAQYPDGLCQRRPDASRKSPRKEDFAFQHLRGGRCLRCR